MTLTVELTLVQLLKLERCILLVSVKCYLTLSEQKIIIDCCTVSAYS